MGKMREILFRGKRLDNGEWVEGTYYKQTLFYGDRQEKHFIITSRETLEYEQSLEYFEVNPRTVSQRTEAKDSNGNWVFEGDIVKSIYEPKDEPAFEEIVVVMWAGGGFFNFYCSSSGEWSFEDWAVDESYLESAASKRIVIGNIYENPGISSFLKKLIERK